MNFKLEDYLVDQMHKKGHKHILVAPMMCRS